MRWRQNSMRQDGAATCRQRGVAALAGASDRADAVYLQLPAWVEIGRWRQDVAVPDDLRAAYEAALAALAAAKGSASIAQIARELTPEVAEDVLVWLEER